jgi:MFS family permease
MAALVTDVPTAPERHRVEGAGVVAAFFRDLLEGLGVVRENRLVATLVASNTIVSLGEGVFSVMFVVWVRQVLNGGALQLGWFMSAQAVGGILGGLAVANLGRRLPPVPVLGLCTIAFGLMDMALFSYPLLWHGIALGLAIIVVVGFPGAATGATWSALLQSGVGDAHRGRVFGLVGALSNLSTLLGTIAAGALGGILGPIFLLNAMQGVGYVVAGSMVLVVLRHAWMRPRAEAVPGQATWSELQ